MTLKKEFKGKQFVMSYGTYEFDAFVADIDYRKGITIHALDPNKINSDPKCPISPRNGEVFCLNFKIPVKNYATSMRERFNYIVDAIRTGRLDVPTFRKAMGHTENILSKMSPCAFR